MQLSSSPPAAAPARTRSQRLRQSDVRGRRQRVSYRIPKIVPARFRRFYVVEPGSRMSCGFWGRRWFIGFLVLGGRLEGVFWGDLGGYRYVDIYSTLLMLDDVYYSRVDWVGEDWDWGGLGSGSG